MLASESVDNFMRVGDGEGKAREIGLNTKGERRLVEGECNSEGREMNEAGERKQRGQLG